MGDLDAMLSELARSSRRAVLPELTLLDAAAASRATPDHVLRKMRLTQVSSRFAGRGVTSSA